MTIEDTIALVQRVHADQKDKGGHPYLGHILRVFTTVKVRLGRLPEGLLSEPERAAILHAALLHDTIEDTEITADDLRALGYGEAVVARVERLSGRAPGTSYIDNIRAMAAEGDLGTMLIKLCDNDDNSAPSRIAQLPQAERSIAQRYMRSRRILAEGIERICGRAV